ncbi:hypothetical protein OSB04_006074 [Centaurea solstitialis]|uniref:TIR domain-containing protein n=1 Tax=Centaurea solstitialis TaxID=347529 RepID=A0AA38WRT6_9ASTR|nr:hypothetical protein OSB04_006074 [Centaurea solstitialis]
MTPVGKRLLGKHMTTKFSNNSHDPRSLKQNQGIILWLVVNRQTANQGPKLLLCANHRKEGCNILFLFTGYSQVTSINHEISSMAVLFKVKTQKSNMMASHMLSIYVYNTYFISLIYSNHIKLSSSKQIHLSMAISSWFLTVLNGIATVLFHCVLRCFHLDSFVGPPHEQIKPSIPPSSSHSTPTPSSSSSQSPKHDVFLSFRGTDTRNTFVDHLYSALEQQGIYTYKDDKTLPRGETIGPSLLKAIEESQVAVIVFSENYADSSWCLQELAHIMKCKDERRLIVMPIFYHVDPSELRKQKGKYGAALAKHESENKNVESWRKALADAGNLSGDVANGPETKFIKEIVDTISNILHVAISSENEDLVGIREHLQDLKSKMQMESDGVLMVGIWGLGGGGKTTLSSALYDEISTKFDGSCFIKDVREKSSKDSLENLQERVLSLVLKQKEMEVVGDVGRLIKSRFRHKKVLMVLDDVDHVNQLKALAGSHNWFGEGSRIIITTRDEHLLNAHKVNVIYNISLLNDNEAYKLFWKHALGHDRHIEDYEMLSKDVVSRAGGLPLALKVLGSFLCGKNMSEWTSALVRLKDIPENDIVERLKISYDGLKPMEKELFLDIACFFRGENKNLPMVILDACGFYPTIGVKVLIEKALITLSKEGTFEMHDLIEEMGHYIVRGENPKNPEKHSRIWDNDVLNIIVVDSMKENDIIEALDITFYNGGCPPSLPKVLANMKELRWIRFDGYETASFPRNFQPMKLCYLELGWCSIKQLWKGYKLLPKIEVLNLSFSSNLVRTPDLTGLPCLETLILKCCNSLKEIHPSIGYHEGLTFVDMERCRSLEKFPPIIRMKKLETLLLPCCFKLCKFPNIQTHMDNLVELKVVPSSIGRYCTNLVSLDLSSCKHLQSIEGNFHRLQHLKGFCLNFSDQTKVPAEGLFDVDCCLQMLSLRGTSLKKFHQVMVSIKLLGFSRSLVRLDLSACNLVDGEISSIMWKEFSNLQALDLSENKFSRLDSSLSQLPRLKYLNLSNCKDLVELPDLPSSLAILVVRSCDSLQIVDLPTNLKWLWKLVLPKKATWVDGNMVVQFMLQGNAVEVYFLSLHFYGTKMSTIRETFVLELPPNWYNEFSGFLIYTTIEAYANFPDRIVIKDRMGRENQDDVLEVATDSKNVRRMCYISFGSLRHTTWWNSTHTKISFSMTNADLHVELVPRTSKAEKPKDATNLSEFWDEEAKYGTQTFKFVLDSKSTIAIEWSFSDKLSYKRRKVDLDWIGLRKNENLDNRRFPMRKNSPIKIGSAV